LDSAGPLRFRQGEPSGRPPRSRDQHRRPGGRRERGGDRGVHQRGEHPSLAHSIALDAQRVRFDFAAGRATGWLRLANDDSLAADAPAFPACDSSSVDFVLRTSSLRAEWDVRIPVFVPSSRATAQLRARVTGVEPSRSRSRSHT